FVNHHIRLYSIVHFGARRETTLRSYGIYRLQRLVGIYAPCFDSYSGAGHLYVSPQRKELGEPSSQLYISRICRRASRDRAQILVGRSAQHVCSDRRNVCCRFLGFGVSSATRRRSYLDSRKSACRNISWKIVRNRRQNTLYSETIAGSEVDSITDGPQRFG